MALMWAACGGMLVFGMAMALLGAVLPVVSLKAQIQLSEAGSLMAGLSLVMLASMLGLGPVMDRYGIKPLAAGAVLTALGLPMIAAARDWRGLLLAVLLLGAGGGALNGAANTLVDGQRFAGTCHRAANWIPLGQTQGRGRMDRYHQADGSARKLVFVYPSAAVCSQDSGKPRPRASPNPRRTTLDSEPPKAVNNYCSAASVAGTGPRVCRRSTPRPLAVALGLRPALP